MRFIYLKLAKSWCIVKNHVKKLIRFFRDHFDGVIRFIEVFFIGTIGIIIAVQANRLTKAQLDLSKAISMPMLSVNEEQIFNTDGIVDTHKLKIYNESGYMTNYKSERLSFISITTSVGYNRFDLKIPLEGFWSVGLHTGKMIGLIETRGYDKNFEKYKSIVSAAEEMVASASYEPNYFLSNIESYVKISFSNVQHENQVLYYKLDPIMGTVMIDASLYNDLLLLHNDFQAKKLLVDIDSSNGEDLVRIIRSLVYD